MAYIYHKDNPNDNEKPRSKEAIETFDLLMSFIKSDDDSWHITSDYKGEEISSFEEMRLVYRRIYNTIRYSGIKDAKVIRRNKKIYLIKA